MNQFRLILLCILIFPKLLLSAEIQIVNLKVEYMEKPLGIDVENPRFSWQMEDPDNQRGCKQTAYQIIVINESGQITWNSGKIKSDISLNIEYAGENLSASTRCNWTVHVWDQKNNQHSSSSWFETGLMNPGVSAWSGAKWIGGGNEDMVLFSQYLPVFTINYTVQLDKESGTTKAGFVYGANDTRLMDKYKNMYNLENKRDSSFFLIEIDISSLPSNGNAQLNLYRAGYTPHDKKNTPYKSFNVPSEIINTDNKYEEHTLELRSELGYTRIYIDGTEKENIVAEINLNPLGQGGDFIAFPVVADIGFFVLKNQEARFSNVKFSNFRNPSNVIFSEKLDGQIYNGIFLKFKNNLSVRDNAYYIRGRESDVFMVADPSQNSMPMLRTKFSSSQLSITKARLYVTSRGIYEMYLNGNRIGNDYFNPGLTQYNKTQLYQTYDVTQYIHQGENVLGALLAEGWWSGGSTFIGGNWNFFGDRQSLIAKLVITYENGDEDIIVTDSSNWKYFGNGPIKYGSFFQGEVYDATKDSLVEGWSTPSYDASQWKRAEQVSIEGHVNQDVQKSGDFIKTSFVGQFGQTVKKIKQLTAIEVKEVRPGVFVYDMGQNMVGVPYIKLSGMGPGKKIVLRFAEVLYPDLPEYKENAGMIMLENIRAAMAQDIYITKGGNEIIHPHFTFHGFRFIEITGIKKPLPLKAVNGTVLSSIHELASGYETSNPKINKLWKNITWSTYGNFLSIPTDCPQRNERLGWSGDISVFSCTATYLANIPQFLRRHMIAMEDLQREDGRFPDVAPIGVGFGETLWGSAGITVAWESYQQFGDKAMLEEHYGAMKKYMDYLIKDINPETGIFKENEREHWSSLGDWLSPESSKNEKTLLWEAYFIYDLELIGKMAGILCKNEDAERFNGICVERKKFFNNTYIDTEMGKTTFRGKKIDTQISYVLPLCFNIFNVNNKELAVKNFAETVARKNKADDGTICPPYALMTGFIGTAWISKALSDNGYVDIAYKLLQQTSYPSWLYSVEQGATTIWERPNSYTHTNGFGGNNRMNSFNHYSFGAVGAWMYSYSLGIARDEASPGFKHFVLQPEPDPTNKMTYARGYYESMYGRIEGSWEIKDNTCRYQFIVPANTSATLYLTAASVDKIVEEGKSLKSVDGVKYLGQKNAKHVFELQPGMYNININDIER